MGLNNPESMPQLPFMKKLSSTKLVPGAKKVRDCWPEARPFKEAGVTIS